MRRRTENATVLSRAFISALRGTFKATASCCTKLVAALGEELALRPLAAELGHRSLIWSDFKRPEGRQRSAVAGSNHGWCIDEQLRRSGAAKREDVNEHLRHKCDLAVTIGTNLSDRGKIHQAARGQERSVGMMPKAGRHRQFRTIAIGWAADKHDNYGL